MLWDLLEMHISSLNILSDNNVRLIMAADLILFPIKVNGHKYFASMRAHTPNENRLIIPFPLIPCSAVQFSA